MAVIYCPQCDCEIPETVAICPSCGFNLDTYDEDGSNTEFNALLNAANKKLSEESDSTEETGGTSTPISQSQIDALLGGNVVDLTGETQVETVKKPAEKPAPQPEAAPKAPEELKEVTVAEQKPEPAETAAAPVPAPAEKKKKERKPVPSAVITVLAAVVALALGFCVSLLLFGDVIDTPEEQFAVRAANAVNSKLNVNEQLCVYKAYVKLGSAADECILYAITDYKEQVSAHKYRVVVNKDSSNVINIYYTVDENSAEYLAMKNSTDPEERIQASVLKSYSDTIEAAHREISIGTPSWVSVDISEINSNITSQQKKAE